MPLTVYIQYEPCFAPCVLIEGSTARSKKISRQFTKNELARGRCLCEMGRYTLAGEHSRHSSLYSLQL